jgi:hypothetical protein
MTLKEITQANKPLLKQFCSQFLQENISISYIYEAFLEKIANEATVSINIHEQSLVEILHSGKYLNIFQTGITDKKIEDKYNQYYKKLMAFDTMFQEVRDIKYGALNLGNMGTNYPSFGGGKWCIHLKSAKIKEQDAKNLVYCLQKYSLVYFDDMNKLSNDFYSEISNFEDVGILALKKHHKELTSDESSWANLILDDSINTIQESPLIEVMMMGEITVQFFESICVKERLAIFYQDLIAQDKNSLSDRDVFFVSQYEYIVTFCIKNKINFKII